MQPPRPLTFSPTLELPQQSNDLLCDALFGSGVGCLSFSIEAEEAIDRTMEVKQTNESGGRLGERSIK